jgi:hypothetical protein
MVQKLMAEKRAGACYLSSSGMPTLGNTPKKNIPCKPGGGEALHEGNYRRTSRFELIPCRAQIHFSSHNDRFIP